MEGVCKRGHVGRLRQRAGRPEGQLVCAECLRLVTVRWRRRHGVLERGTPEYTAHMAGRPVGPGTRAKLSAALRRDHVGYSGAHARNRRERGRASEYTCVECTAPAAHWSLDPLPGSTSLRVQVGGPHDGRTYSLSAADYVARCSPCHARHDAATAS